MLKFNDWQIPMDWRINSSCCFTLSIDYGTEKQDLTEQRDSSEYTVKEVWKRHTMGQRTKKRKRFRQDGWKWLIELDRVKRQRETKLLKHMNSHVHMPTKQIRLRRVHRRNTWKQRKEERQLNRRRDQTLLTWAKEKHIKSTKTKHHQNRLKEGNRLNTIKTLTLTNGPNRVIRRYGPQPLNRIGLLNQPKTLLKGQRRERQLTSERRETDQWHQQVNQLIGIKRDKPTKDNLPSGRDKTDW